MKIKFILIFILTIISSPFAFIYADEDLSIIDPILPPVQVEKILIRANDTILYQGEVDLPDSGMIDIVDNIGTSRSVNTNSVLGVLYILDQTSTAFSLSNLQYFDTFNSFYLKCITPENLTQMCDNWQYVVNDTTPSTSMDSTILLGGESIVIYFGSPHQIIFDKTSMTEGESFSATAQKYNYTDNTWSVLTGVTIGVTQPNPDDVWNPTIIASSVVDTNGIVNISLVNIGTYDIGIAEDFYFPSYKVIVNAKSSGGGGGSGGGIPTIFSVPKAVSYLESIQSSDGSFGGSDMYTDWVAIALGATGKSGNIQTNIISYMASHNTISSSLTDNERRAMALLALGQNPYLFNNTDYINAIIKSFDGTQFGDISLINDDIFALIPLASAGYTSNDDIISKDITFILSKQSSDGSWEGSVDLTAATVQALYPFSSAPGVSPALSNAGSYLQNLQGVDGGWGNIYSSSWVIQAMNTLGASWVKNGKSTADYLGLQQTTDGAAALSSETIENRIWATSYAIPAALKMSWSTIMHAVSKPIISNTLSFENNSDSKKEIPLQLTQTATIPNQVVLLDSDIPTTELKVLKQKTVSTPKKTSFVIQNPNVMTEISSNNLGALALQNENSSPRLILVIGILLVITLVFFIYRFRIKKY